MGKNSLTIASELNIHKQKYVQNDLDLKSDLSIFKAFENFLNNNGLRHERVKNNKNKSIDSLFSYLKPVMNIISNLNIVESCHLYETPTKVIKMNKGMFANFIANHFNYCTFWD